MPIDNRDWYRDQYNKRSGYVERSTFRTGHADHQRRKYRTAWRRNISTVFWWLLAAFNVWYWCIR